MAFNPAPQERLYLRREDFSKVVAVDLFERRLHVLSTAQALHVSVLSIRLADGDDFVVVAADDKGLSIRRFDPNTKASPLLVEATAGGAGAGVGVVAGPSGAGASSAEPGIRNAQTALSIRPADVTEVSGLWVLVDGNGIIQHLFYSAANCKERIGDWLRAYFAQLERVGIPGMGYPPLYINGLIKTGKSYLLRTVLPALVLEQACSTRFSPFILQLDLINLPVDQGYDAMLQHLLEMIVLRARNIGLASQMLEHAAQFETRPRTTSPIYEPVLQQIFELMPHPCIVVIDEVQRLVLPQVPGTGNIDVVAQKQARRLLRTLMCKSASTCAFAVTGSSLTNFWVQLALVEKNSLDPLSYCCDLHLAPVHNAEALSYVKGFLERPEGTHLKAGEALPKAVSMQDWAVNAALVGYAHQVKQLGVPDAQVESAVMEKIRQETAAEWRSLLADLPAAERRRYLRLAVPSEGLDLYQVHPHLYGLRSMLSALTVPVYEGATRRIFASTYHRAAMLMMITNTGEMQDLRLLSGQPLSLAAADELVHMIVIGNVAKAIRLADAKRLQELLEDPLSKLLSKWGPADSWAESHAWFQEVWFAAENQGKGKQGVSAVEMISSGTAYAYKQQRDQPTTTNAHHLAWYLQMLRNIMCHTGEDAASAEGIGGVAADASGAGVGSGAPGAAAGGDAGNEATISAGLSEALTPQGLDRSLEILRRCPFAPEARELFQALLAYANASQPSSPSPPTSEESSTPADSTGASSSASAFNAHSTGSAAGAAVSSPLLGASGWVSGPRASESPVVASPQLPMLGAPGRRRACTRGVAVPARLQGGWPSRRLSAPRCAATHVVHALQRAQAPACRASGKSCSLRRL